MKDVNMIALCQNITGIIKVSRDHVLSEITVLTDKVSQDLDAIELHSGIHPTHGYVHIVVPMYGTCLIFPVANLSISQ